MRQVLSGGIDTAWIQVDPSRIRPVSTMQHTLFLDAGHHPCDGCDAVAQSCKPQLMGETSHHDLPVAIFITRYDKESKAPLIIPVVSLIVLVLGSAGKHISAFSKQHATSQWKSSMIIKCSFFCWPLSFGHGTSQQRWWRRWWLAVNRGLVVMLVMFALAGLLVINYQAAHSMCLHECMIERHQSGDYNYHKKLVSVPLLNPWYPQHWSIVTFWRLVVSMILLSLSIPGNDDKNASCLAQDPLERLKQLFELQSHWRSRHLDSTRSKMLPWSPWRV